MSVTGGDSEWSLNLPQGPQSLSRLVVSWPRHVPELSFLCDSHNEYGPYATLESPGQWLLHFLAICCTASGLQHSFRLPFPCLSARPIWHSKMQLHVSKWSVRICRPWWHCRRACRDVACAPRHWAVCLLKHTGLMSRLQSSCPVQFSLGAPATGGVTPEKLFTNSATRPDIGKSVGDDGRLLATSIILGEWVSSSLSHDHQGDPQHFTLRAASRAVR